MATFPLSNINLVLRILCVRQSLLDIRFQINLLPTIKLLWIGIGLAGIIGVAAVVFFNGGYPFLGDEDSTVTTTSDTTTTTTTTTTTINTTTTTTTKPEEVIPIGELKVFFVEGTNFLFNHTTITVNKGDTVRITFTNIGGVSHNFGIPNFLIRTNTIPAGSSDTIEFIADKSGTFDFDCSVSGHRGRGMLGQVIVE